jgi:AcrR family transcriptional regulator
MADTIAARRRRADGERSRRTILEAAARLATVEGLEGLSISRLADHVGMSKSGLYAHFGSKEELQLATIETASAIFAAEVVEPALAAEGPRAQLEALCERFLAHVERRVFPGGCFFASTAAEFDTRPGAVNARLAAGQREWLGLIERLAAAAQADGSLDAREDPAQLAFELNSYLSLGNALSVLLEDPVHLERARGAVRARLAAALARD